jgi:hypothetical protein
MKKQIPFYKKQFKAIVISIWESEKNELVLRSYRLQIEKLR